MTTLAEFFRKGRGSLANQQRTQAHLPHQNTKIFFGSRPKDDKKDGQMIKKIFAAILLLSFPLCAKASFYSEQISPTLERGFSKDALPLWSAGILATLLIEPLNKDIQDQYGNHQLLSAEQSSWGDHYIRYGGNILITLVQLYFDPENAYPHIRGLFFTGAFTHLLKVSVNEERPNHSDHYSFPSGHTSAAFSSATSLAYAYGWKAGVPAFSMALLTGASRIADDMHWASDVVAGAFLGVIWGQASFYKLTSTSGKITGEQSHWMPTYEKGQLSMSYTYQF